MFTPPISMSIDLFTHAYMKLRRKKSPEPPVEYRPSVSVLIPTFNEGARLGSTIETVMQQTYPVKNVYILDDMSNETTRHIAELMSKKHPNVTHVRDHKRGKAGNINAIVARAANARNRRTAIEEYLDPVRGQNLLRQEPLGNPNAQLGDYVLVLDSDVRMEPRCLEEMVHHSYQAAAVTGRGTTTAPKRAIPRALHAGETFANNVFEFRKKAQEARRGIPVICGAVALYRRSVLEQHRVPERTMTEDTDYTWLLQEEGLRVRVAEEAGALGGSPDTFGGYWRRYNRWFSGTFQCLYSHAGTLHRAPGLCYTTILPGLFESVAYSFTFASLPVIYAVAPEFATGILAADLIFTIPFLPLYEKGFARAILDIPSIYAFKYFTSIAAVYTGLKTTAQRIAGKTHWGNTWQSSTSS